MSTTKKTFVLKAIDAQPIILGLPLGQFMILMVAVLLVFLLALKSPLLGLVLAAGLFGVKKMILDKGILNEKKIFFTKKKYIIKSHIFYKKKSTLS